MASVVDYQQTNTRPFQYHRKPVPTDTAQRTATPQTPYSPDDYGRLQQQEQQTYPQSHSRAPSSSVLPPQQTTQSPQTYSPQNQYPAQGQASMAQYTSTRRTLSNATASTDSTSGAGRQNSMASSLQRTTSSRSGSQQSSYVALMRKQKATVWSDRSQHEDPRMLAQQRAAKMRAEREISKANSVAARTSNSGSGSLTGGVRSRIRHHGTPKAQQYAPAANPASGVPMRLSAREVGEDESDDDPAGRNSHQRNDSGRSSFGSNRQHPQVVNSGSTGSTPPSGPHSGPQSPGYNAGEHRLSDGATPLAEGNTDYFKNAPAPLTVHKRVGSNSSERENSFGEVSGLPRRVRPVESGQTLEDLQRRGSVDERTMTMPSYGRLFIANPDADD